jgi:hypothetical protein
VFRKEWLDTPLASCIKEILMASGDRFIGVCVFLSLHLYILAIVGIVILLFMLNLVSITDLDIIVFDSEDNKVPSTTQVT